MLSFMSSTTTLPAPASSSCSLTSVNDDQVALIKKFKAELKAVPAGLTSNSASSSATGRKKTSKGQKKNSRNNGRRLKQVDIVSKSYNTIASRPIALPRTTNVIYYANLRLDNTSVLVTSITVPTYGSNSFSLNDFVNRTEYTGLFDQYRIEEFEVWIEPINSQSVTSASVGYFCSAVDLDDSTTPTAVSQVEGKQNAITTGGYDGHYHRFHPHMAIAAYSGVFTSFASTPAQWIDSGSPSVQHYGLKYAAAPTGNVMTYQLSLRARVAFRQGGI